VIFLFLEERKKDGQTETKQKKGDKDKENKIEKIKG
jgi:hypothetical protein